MTSNRPSSYTLQMLISQVGNGFRFTHQIFLSFFFFLNNQNIENVVRDCCISDAKQPAVTAQWRQTPSLGRQHLSTLQDSTLRSCVIAAPEPRQVVQRENNRAPVGLKVTLDSCVLSSQKGVMMCKRLNVPHTSWSV